MQGGRVIGWRVAFRTWRDLNRQGEKTAKMITSDVLARVLVRRRVGEAFFAV